jgi:tRNA/rRNA methyltransferase
VAGSDHRRRATLGATTGPQPVVVLVRPQMGENIGTTARAMLNFGLTRLRLVDPVCGWPNAKAVNAASGASVVLNDVEIFDDTRAAVADLHRVVATTARPREMVKPVLTGEAAGRELRGRLAAGERVGVLFGPERTGLENDDVTLADAIVSIPLNPGFASLNLAQAVLLVAYEFHRAHDTTPPLRAAEALEPAVKADVDRLVDDLVALLEDTSFFRSADRRDNRIRELELLLTRRELQRAELQTLRGVIKGLVQRGRSQSV